MTNYHQANNSTLLRLACAIVFILFVFLYLYCFQADLLFMLQHVLSGGTTHYDKAIGTVVITAVLYLVHVGAKKLGGFGGGLYALTYFPSLLLLVVLTAVADSHTGSPFRRLWLWLAPLLLAAYVCVSLLSRYKLKLSQAPMGADSTFVGTMWKNLSVMALMFIAVCLCGNSDRVFHYRLRIERLLSSGDFSEALRVGAKSDDADANLTMLRAYAMSRTKQMGERLFEYPLAGGSNALLPDGKDVRCLVYPERQIFKALSIRKKGDMTPMEYLRYIENNGLAMKPAVDYMLCGYLLDKDLDGFVKAVIRKYDVSSPSLPKHYKEALTLYTHLRSNPSVVYHDEVMDADYADFQSLGRKYKDKTEREAYVRDMFGGTYWCYYFYGGTPSADKMSK